MTTNLNMAEIAALVGDPGRANMLTALLDGRALTASELASVAGVTPATASGHLAKLLRGRLLELASQGRHRYFRLASVDVARMLEAIMVVGVEPTTVRRTTPRIAPELREARTCYDHLAGRLAVSLADALVDQGAIILSGEAGEVTDAGHDFLQGFGVALEPPRKTRRIYCRPCLDWSERRSHLGGVIGAALFDRLAALDWIRRAKAGRAVTITPKGQRGFLETFGIGR